MVVISRGMMKRKRPVMVHAWPASSKESYNHKLAAGTVGGKLALVMVMKLRLPNEV